MAKTARLACPNPVSSLQNLTKQLHCLVESQQVTAPHWPPLNRQCGECRGLHEPYWGRGWELWQGVLWWVGNDSVTTQTQKPLPSLAAQRSTEFFLSQYLRGSQMAWPGKESACQCRRHRKLGFNSWVRKIPWRRKWQPIPVFLPEKSHRQRSLVGYSLKDGKESDTTEHSTVSIIFRVEALVLVTVKDAKSYWMPLSARQSARYLY